MSRPFVDGMVSTSARNTAREVITRGSRSITTASDQPVLATNVAAAAIGNALANTGNRS